MMIGPMLRALRDYLRTPAARSAEQLGDAIEEEIAFHIAARAQELMDRGLPEAEAYCAARQKFGDPSRVAAECHEAALGGLIVWHRLHLAVTASLAAVVGWLCLTLFRTDGHAPSSPLPPGIASMLAHDWTGDVAGQIRDEAGRPLQDAQVLVVVKTWPDHSYFQRAYLAVTTRDGRFLIQDVHPLNERYEVQVAAVANGRVLKSSYHSAAAGELDPVVMELAPSSGLAVQVESEQGTRLPDVEVLPQRRIEAGGTEHLVYFDSAQSLVRRTDDRGRAELPYFRSGDTANFLVRTAQGEWKSHAVKVPDAGEVVTIRTAL